MHWYNCIAMWIKIHSLDSNARWNNSWNHSIQMCLHVRLHKKFIQIWISRQNFDLNARLKTIREIATFKCAFKSCCIRFIQIWISRENLDLKRAVKNNPWNRGIQMCLQVTLQIFEACGWRIKTSFTSPISAKRACLYVRVS